MATWTKSGTTITLTVSTLMSDLISDPDIPVIANDTIQLAGHSLIVDADAVNYPVTIANSGNAANLELRDLSRIKLNNRLPTNVHPYVDPAHPLPVSAEPGIGGDPYRTSLTANARVEIQLNNNYELGGSSASLPTENRQGAFWAKATSVSGNTITFDRPFPLHVGDVLHNIMVYNNFQRCTVTAATENTATVDPAPARNNGGDVWVLSAGGVCVNRLIQTAAYSVINADIDGGTLVLLGPNSAFNAGSPLFYYKTRVNIHRLSAFVSPTVSGNGFMAAPPGGVISVRELACGRLFQADNANTSTLRQVGQVAVGELVCCCYSYDTSGGCSTSGPVCISGGGISTCNFAQYIGGYGIHRIENMDFVVLPSTVSRQVAIDLRDCTIGGTTINAISEMAGTITPTNGAFYHATAASSDVTWRYTDYPVPAGSSLRLYCSWQQAGENAKASVAVTDTATWWPQLWLLGVFALASVEFTENTSEKQVKVLQWTNVSQNDMQVRVWECATGYAGAEGVGYLKVQKISGGVA